LIKAMRACPQVIIAAVDGICAGAGACVTMAADLRYGTERSKVGFLFARVGLAGCDMGACAMLPRIIGQGRAAEMFYSGRMMPGPQAHEWGFFNELAQPEDVLAYAQAKALEIASGPFFAHSMTKRMMDQEWAMALGEAIEHEAQAQAICMQTEDFTRAFEAFAAKQSPVFEGN
jgi:enoyl-CoA hydratase/carnithine racemase